MAKNGSDERNYFEILQTNLDDESMKNCFGLKHIIRKKITVVERIKFLNYCKKIHLFPKFIRNKTKNLRDIFDEQFWQRSLLNSLQMVSLGKGNKDYIDDWHSYLRRSKDHFQQTWRKDERKFLKMKRYTVIRKLGEGSYGTVVLAQKHNTLLAVKIIKKSGAGKSNYLDVQKERRIHRAMKFPFIIRLFSCFSDSMAWYLVMPFVAGGDLFDALRKVKRFSEQTAQFYAAQILLALEYLQYMGIVYRDLKPENILLEVDGYIKLADMGFCKKVTKRTYTYCGTTEYIAPEIILSNGYGFAADWWSFGVLVYEMCEGYSPFVAADELSILKSIVRCEYQMPNRFSPSLTELIRNLLQKNPLQRLGGLSNGASDVKGHEWFFGVDWLAILNRKVTSPYKPKARGPPAPAQAKHESQGSEHKAKSFEKNIS